MVARGLIPEVDRFEGIRVQEVYLLLKDHGIQFELMRDYLSDEIQAVGPEHKIQTLQKIIKLIDPSRKDPNAALIEEYKKEFDGKKSNEILIRPAEPKKKTMLKDLINAGRKR